MLCCEQKPHAPCGQSRAGASAEFKLYTQGHADVGYSSNSASDEYEAEGDEAMLLGEDNFEESDALMYDALVALDSDSIADTDTTTLGIPRTKPPPPLSSVRLYALEAVSEQTARKGVWAAGPHRHAVPC